MIEGLNMTEADFAAMFDGDFTFKIGSGAYHGQREDWEYIEVPEILCDREVAQCVRDRKDHESAQHFTMNSSGERVFWYFKIDYRDGGSCGYAEFSRADAKNKIQNIMARQDVRYFELSRNEGDFTKKGYCHRFG